MPQVYPADHTFLIRQRLKSMAIMCLTGAALAAAAAGVLALLGTVGDQNRGLLRVAWVVDILTFAVAAIGLLITLILYRTYLRHRADLDAAGAEAYGEFRARIHRG